MSAADRKARAESRRRVATLRKTRLHARDDGSDRIRGAQAISLVHRLTLECWSLAACGLPAYSRSETPYRFVGRQRS